jgi:hypothetical protein
MTRVARAIQTHFRSKFLRLYLKEDLFVMFNGKFSLKLIKAKGSIKVKLTK